MRKTAARISIVAFGCLAVAAFQNCSDVQFSGSPITSAESVPVLPGGGPELGSQDPFVDVPTGVAEGHFDVDTSSQSYEPSKGETDHHVHEYDDKFGVTYVDYFKLADTKFREINELVGASVPFVLVVANAQLSPGGVISINGQSTPVVDYQRRVSEFIAGNQAALQIFTLDGSAGQKLNSLRIGFGVDAIKLGRLVGTETGCVVRNDLGKLGEYRNGALTIQAIAVSSLNLDPVMGVAKINGGLLWESTIFHHWDNGCY